ncbi:MAG: CHASE2 domain-containing protein [bacterium]|nr:CHASE2 domain-containing protein [bacterium]
MLLGRIPPQTFKDKILLLGFTSTVYQDIHSVPFQEGIFPGVEVHATICVTSLSMCKNELLHSCSLLSGRLHAPAFTVRVSRGN